MGACCGAGFLNFVANTDELAEEDCINIVSTIIKDMNFYCPLLVRDIIKDKAGSWNYSGEGENSTVSFNWLSDEEAAPILSFAEESRGFAPYSDFEYLDFDFLYPADFIDDKKINLTLPRGSSPLFLRCSSLYVTKMMLKDKIIRFKDEGKNEDMISFHEKILKDIKRCSEYGLMYSIR